jgi:hypothetical protein
MADKKKTIQQITEELAAKARTASARNRNEDLVAAGVVTKGQELEDAREEAITVVLDEAKKNIHDAAESIRALTFSGVMPLLYDLRKGKSQHPPPNYLDGTFVIPSHAEIGDLTWAICLRVTVGSKEAWTIGFARGIKAKTGEPILVACSHRFSTGQREWFGNIAPHKDGEKNPEWASDMFANMYPTIKLSA